MTCPAIAEVFSPWRPKPLATHSPLRNWPICGMPCTVATAAEHVRYRHLAELGKMVAMRR